MKSLYIIQGKTNKIEKKRKLIFFFNFVLKIQSILFLRNLVLIVLHYQRESMNILFLKYLLKILL